MQEGSYFFNHLVVPTAHNQLRFVKDRNCIHATLDDRCLDTMPLYVRIPYLHLRDVIASSTIELASLVRLSLPLPFGISEVLRRPDSSTDNLFPFVYTLSRPTVSAALVHRAVVIFLQARDITTQQQVKYDPAYWAQGVNEWTGGQCLCRGKLKRARAGWRIIRA